MMFRRPEEKDTLFRQPEPAQFFGPRAATTDARQGRQKRVIENTLTSVPGMFSRPAMSPQDQEIYKAGLQSFLAGDREGAVMQWKQIPNHPEARRAMQRIFDQIRAEGEQ
jgi:hypothetical protein